MLNIERLQGDFQGDLVPAPNSPHISPGGQPSVMLGIGHSLYSPGGGFRLALQTDGNVVLQCITDATLPRKWAAGQPLAQNDLHWNQPIWATGTNEQGVFELDMQADGNLVAYSGAGPRFASQTDGHPGAFLRMQDDGNLVILTSSGQPIWSTKTNARV